MQSTMKCDTELAFAARSILYGLLQRVFSEVPDEMLHEQEISPLVIEALGIYADLAVEFSSIIGGEDSDGIRDMFSVVEVPAGISLEGVYNRLFVGVGKPSICPWESIYFTGNPSLFQANTLSVRAFYARFGLQARDYPRVADDHLAIELAFLRDLAIRTTSAQDDEKKELLDAQREFLEEHLGKWVGSFCEQVREQDTSDYYSQYADILEAFVRADTAMLGL